ncbi:MAG: HEPN domain-containing protein [Elusimicrobiota bacterium]
MPQKVKTRDVHRQFYVNYAQRSLECFHSAKLSLKSGEWTAAAINAIHACIAGCDTMCVYYLGKRHAGEGHNETVVLFKSINDSDGVRSNAKRLARILSIKNIAEYEERLVYRKEAEDAVKDCERFLEFVNKQLPK